MVNNLFNSNFAKHSKFAYDFVGNTYRKKEWLAIANQYEKYINKFENESPKDYLIPKKIHQIWLGKHKLPKKYLKWINSWKLHNPDWEYKLWDENSIKELDQGKFNIFSKKINPGYRSDIVRYLLLKKYGGLYIDTDFECLKPIPLDLLKFKFVSCLIFDNKPCIANGMMMSIPNYILLDNILKAKNTNNPNNEIKNIMDNSGPGKLTEEYFSLIKNIEKEALILPSNYFYPYPNFMLNSRVNKYNTVEKISVGIHHWEMSWMKGNLSSRIKRKFKKYFKLLFKSSTK